MGPPELRRSFASYVQKDLLTADGPPELRCTGELLCPSYVQDLPTVDGPRELRCSLAMHRICCQPMGHVNYAVC